MSTLATLAVVLTLSAESYHAGLAAAEKQAGSSSSNIQNTLSSIGAGIATAGIAAVTGAVGLMGDFLVKSTEKAEEAEGVQAQLAQAIKSTGGAAGVTADMVNSLADKFDKTTKFAADQTVAGENLLLTFTNIGKDIFPQTTQAMLDLSQAMGQDMKSSAIQLGKALNDPEKGVTALTRVGVTFTEQQKKQIETMEKSGNIAGAQKVILAELSKEFGGSAEAAGNTAAGKMAIFQHSMERVQETIGNALLPIVGELAGKLADLLESPAVQNGIKALTEGITTFFNGFNVGYGNGDAISGLINAFYSLDGISPIFDDIGDAIANISNVVIDLSMTVGQNLVQAFNFFSAWWTVNGKPIQAAGQAMFSVIIETAQTLAAQIMPWLQEQMVKFQSWFVENGPLISATISTFAVYFVRFMDSVQLMWQFVGPILSGLVNFILGALKVAMQAFTGDWSGAWNTALLTLQGTDKSLRDTLMGFMNWVLQTFAGTNMTDFLKTWQNNFDAAGRIVSSFVSDTLAALGKISISSVISGAVNLVVPGRAAGGPAGGLTMVGENGPELVNLPSGSYVHSNQDSQQMMASQSSGPSAKEIGKEVALALMQLGFSG